MTLEEFQKNILEKVIYKSNSKDKFKTYYYNIFDLTAEINLLEEILLFSGINKPAVLNQISIVISSLFDLLNELKFPIVTEEFSLEEFKNNVKNQQPQTGVLDYNFYTVSMRFSLGRLHGIIRKTFIESKQELTSVDKLAALNIIYDIIVNNFMLIDYLGYNIDIILENYLNK